jgi:arylsulfatase A-like enzyme/Flp pilus assembly protein TadD
MTVDTLRADRVGAYGAASAHTPTLDALAEEGTRFATALAPTPLTLPSHASLLTGLEPLHHGVRDNALFRLPDEVETLPERLRARGFATAAFVGAVVLDRQYGLARGFDRYDDRMGGRRAVGERGFAERRAGDVVDAALAWLEDAPARFFLWVHLYDPHASYDPPPGFLAVTPGDAYAAEIAYADAQLARLREAVEARHARGGTLWVATSDHGESLGEHGELTHGLGLYDTTQRVPLLLAGPGVPAGRVVEAPVGLIDVAPTILGLLGEAAPADADGRDLRPLLRGEVPTEQRSFLLETLAPRLEFGWSPLFALRTQHHKWVLAPRPELYDLASDPAERDDRVDDPELAALRAELADALEARLAKARPAAWTSPPDAAERAALEALGYVAPSVREPVEDLHAVSGLDPKDGIPGLVPISHAMSYLELDRPREAVALLERVAWEGWFVDTVRSEASRRAGEPEAALAHAERAVAAAPGALPARVERARALEALGRLDEAERQFVQARGLDVADPEPLLGLGRIAERRGEPEQARGLYEEAQARRGGSQEAAWRLAALEIVAGELAVADARLAPLPPEALLRARTVEHLARAELEAGLAERASERLLAGLRRRPRSVTLLRLASELGIEPTAPGRSRRGVPSRAR